MKLNPYITFDGTCEAAMNFYRNCLGGEFESLNYFKDGPADMGAPAHLADKIMHMALRFGDNVLMGADSMGETPTAGNIALSMNADAVGNMDDVFNKLSVGGQIIMPLEDTFWGARFGMSMDKYGVKWMFNARIENA